MATTIDAVANSATPYSKKFKLTGDGVDGLFSIADFLAALDEGPLKTTLRRTPTTSIADFNVNVSTRRSNKIRIYQHMGGDADASFSDVGNRNIRWVNGATTALAGLTCNVAQGDVIFIEIRLNHSAQA